MGRMVKHDPLAIQRRSLFGLYRFPLLYSREHPTHALLVHRQSGKSVAARVNFRRDLFLSQFKKRGRSGSLHPMSLKFITICAGGFCLAMALMGCQSGELRQQNGRACTQIEEHLDLSERVEALNLLSEAFAAHCDDLVVRYGTQARSQFRHKTFSVTREAMNVFVPDGTFIEYFLESYERGYLSILLAASYLRMHKSEDSKVELRDLDHELFAPIYNYGEDPVNLLLSAVLWEGLGEIGEARVDWLRLRDLPGLTKKEDKALRRFAGERVSRIDSGEGAAVSWHAYRVGRFPPLDWELQFTNSTSGYFSITPRQPFLASCESETGLRLSTESWFDKIAIRHSQAYHPLLNVQTWIRLPFGVAYSLIPLAAGAGVMVGGCVLDAAGEGKGALCQLSVIGGMAIMSTAPRVLEGALRPDLRHWEHVPAAFVVTRASRPELEPCLAKLGTVQRLW
ncbi:MAG: hypothetical protein A2V62_04670 [Nitrospirae bacterium RBG_19FT_COMBO_58_9]|nr:MAG: hypothetical protein A2V62_04670 [Nitrospirae bacterium RBG_19FT_COMBO_58_9]